MKLPQCFAFCIFLFGGMLNSQLVGQDASEKSFVSSGTEHVTTDAFLTSRIDVHGFLTSPELSILPIEIAQAWGKENLGVDLMDIIEIKNVTAAPTGPGGVPTGFLVTLSQDYDPADISADILDGEPQVIDGRKVYSVSEGGQTFHVHSVNPRTVVIASPEMLGPMVESKTGPSEATHLSNLIQSESMDESNSQSIISLKSVRPMLQGIVAQAGGDVPPEFAGLLELPDLVDALIVENGTTGAKQRFSIEMICVDAAAAEKTKDILTQSIQEARKQIVASMSEGIRGEGRMPAAQLAYINRMGDYVEGLLKSTVDGKRVTIQIEAAIPIATTGVLAGLLLPAVQAAREAARRTSAANNLKQIALAFHIYHDVHGHFPPPAITDKDGKPLLSWRVAILPYIEQQALYDQFHLDEPWDSDHNLKLSKMMVATFTDPSTLLPPGETVFRTNPEAFEAGKKRRIRDILDGTSNTIMVFEADQSEAVVWTKPSRLKIDPADPFAQMGHSHPGGFNAAFFDGSVRFISIQSGIEQLKALMTSQGGENVNNF